MNATFTAPANLPAPVVSRSDFGGPWLLGIGNGMDGLPSVSIDLSAIDAQGDLAAWLDAAADAFRSAAEFVADEETQDLAMATLLNEEWKR